MESTNSISLALSDNYASQLKKCHKLRDPFAGKSIHAQIIKCGLHTGIYLINNLVNFYSKTGFPSAARQVFDEIPIKTTYCWNTILSMYVSQGRFDEALDVFYRIPERDSVSWTTMIVGYNHVGRFSNAIRLFVNMISEKVPITDFTSTNILASCAGAGASKVGRKVHALVVKNGLSGNVSVATSLLNMYAKFGNAVKANAIFDWMRVKNRSSWNSLIFLHMQSGSFDSALSLFEKMEKRDIVSWNAIIAGYNKRGFNVDALDFFSNMLKDSSLKPDKFTFSSILSCCGSLGKLSLGRQIHARIITHEIETSVALITSLISMYSKCGEVEVANTLLERCGSSNPNVIAFTTILDGYVKLGDVNPARKVFDSLTNPDVVTWTAMIVGYLDNGLSTEALDLFRLMMRRGPKPNVYTLSAILSASSMLASLDHGKQIHASSIRSMQASSVCLSNALITMYSKGGSIGAAKRVFNLTRGNRDTVTWTSMIVALAQHGLGEEAIKLFDSMIGNRIKPDHITYVGVLSACTHNGLVEKGWRYYNMMRNVHGIKPSLSHYSCMIDLLCRAGMLQEAFDFIQAMPIKPDAMVWGSLLSACKVKKNTDLAEVAAERLLLVDPESSGAYSTLASVYLACGKLEESAKIRKSMKEKGLKKEYGISSIRIQNTVHTFGVEDVIHPQKDDIYKMIEKIYKEMKRDGFCNERSVLHDLDDEG